MIRAVLREPNALRSPAEIVMYRWARQAADMPPLTGNRGNLPVSCRDVRLQRHAPRSSAVYMHQMTGESEMHRAQRPWLAATSAGEQ